MPNPRPIPSLRTELLLTLGVLAAAALAIAVVSVFAVTTVETPGMAGTFLFALIALDVAVFVLFGAYQLDRLVLHPLRAALESAEAIASGDLSRRMPAGSTRELQALAASVNRMTERLLAEHTRVMRAEKLASVGRLAAGLAHEIGNPLGAINGYAHILRRSVDADTGGDALAGIDREAARIDRIIRGLLDYARPRRLTPVKMDVGDSLREAITLLTDQGVLRRIPVEADLPAEPLPIFADRQDVDQIFVNILLNAADAVGGEGRVTVYARKVPLGALLQPNVRRVDDPADIVVPREPNARVQSWLDAARRPAAVIQVVVADSGPGVDEADAERIFEPFYTTREPGKGTGLGLAIVARIVDNVGGTVWVQPAREGGAAFVFLFPVATTSTDVRQVIPEDGSTAGAAR
jgi:signal transduction histidine kinase